MEMKGGGFGVGGGGDFGEVAYLCWMSIGAAAATHGAARARSSLLSSSSELAASSKLGLGLAGSRSIAAKLRVICRFAGLADSLFVLTGRGAVACGSLAETPVQFLARLRMPNQCTPIPCANRGTFWSFSCVVKASKLCCHELDLDLSAPVNCHFLPRTVVA